MAYENRNCDYCGKQYKADARNLKRGWGLCCSKSCAAHKREKSRPDYDPKKVAENNYKRKYGNRKSAYFEYDEHPFSSEGLGQW